MLRYDLVQKAVDYVKNERQREDMNFSIDTNGTLLTEEQIRYFIDHKFYLQISLDGPQRVHDANRVYPDGSGSFEKVIKVLDTVHSIDEDYFMDYTLVALTMAPPYPVQEISAFFAQEPYKHLNVIVGFVDEEGIDLMEMFGYTKDDNVWEEIKGYRKDYMVKMCGGQRQELPPFSKMLFDQELIELCTRMPHKGNGRISCNGICVPGGRKLFISVDGTLFPCEKVGSDFPIGNVTTGFDLDVINKYITDYKQLCEKHCHSCWAASMCRLCFAGVRREGYISEERKLEECQFERMYWHNALIDCTTIQERCPESLEFINDVVVS
jgi:uncharacterized protein